MRILSLFSYGTFFRFKSFLIRYQLRRPAGSQDRRDPRGAGCEAERSGWCCEGCCCEVQRGCCDWGHRRVRPHHQGCSVCGRPVLRDADAHPLLCVSGRPAREQRHAGAQHQPGGHPLSLNKEIYFPLLSFFTFSKNVSMEQVLNTSVPLSCRITPIFMVFHPFFLQI